MYFEVKSSGVLWSSTFTALLRDADPLSSDGYVKQRQQMRNASVYCENEMFLLPLSRLSILTIDHYNNVSAEFRFLFFSYTLVLRTWTSQPSLELIVAWLAEQFCLGHGPVSLGWVPVKTVYPRLINITICFFTRPVWKQRRRDIEWHPWPWPWLWLRSWSRPLSFLYPFSCGTRPIHLFALVLHG